MVESDIEKDIHPDSVSLRDEIAELRYASGASVTLAHERVHGEIIHDGVRAADIPGLAGVWVGIATGDTNRMNGLHPQSVDAKVREIGEIDDVVRGIGREGAGAVPQVNERALLALVGALRVDVHYVQFIHDELLRLERRDDDREIAVGVAVGVGETAIPDPVRVTGNLITAR